MGSLAAADVIEVRIIEREHQELRFGLSNLEGTIEEASRLSQSELRDRIARTTAWAHRQFLPHAAWEEAWMYAQLDEATGSPWTTRALRFQHEQIRELATALETVSIAAYEHWTAEIVCRVVAAMARLDALISAHLAQEELFVLPFLEEGAGHAARAHAIAPR
jgi:hemerythrin-like domain-containing protein